jgi:hypothetical protein
MVGEKSNPALADFDRYRCLSCGTVVRYDRYGSKGIERDAEGKR